MNLPEEAVEAAAIVLYENDDGLPDWEQADEQAREYARNIARMILEPAFPIIKAHVWETIVREIPLQRSTPRLFLVFLRAIRTTLDITE